MNAITRRAERSHTAMTRRDLLLSLSAVAIGPHLVSGQTRPQVPSVLPIPVTTLNHVNFSCTDPLRTAAWYQKVFGMPSSPFPLSPGWAGNFIVLKVGTGPSYISLTKSGTGELFGTTLNLPNPGGRPHVCWGVKGYNADRLIRGLSALRWVTSGRSILQPVVRPPATVLQETRIESPDGHLLQFHDERSCGGGGYLGDECTAYGQAVQQPGDPPPIVTSTINHVKLVVPDLKRSLAFYQKLTDMRIQPSQGPVAILRIGTGPQHLALTEGSREATSRVHVGLGVERFDADQLLKRLTAHGVTAGIHMRELLLEAPDGVELQLTAAR